MIKVYGIPHCDTVKKARAWLNERGLAHDFHDFKKLGVPETELHTWIETLGLDILVNRRGTTWRQLPPDVQQALSQPHHAHTHLLAHPSVIKRPVVLWPHGLWTVGFDAQVWANHG